MILPDHAARRNPFKELLFATGGNSPNSTMPKTCKPWCMLLTVLSAIEADDPQPVTHQNVSAEVESRLETLLVSNPNAKYLLAAYRNWVPADAKNVQFHPSAVS